MSECALLAHSFFSTIHFLKSKVMLLSFYFRMKLLVCAFFFVVFAFLLSSFNSIRFNEIESIHKMLTRNQVLRYTLYRYYIRQCTYIRQQQQQQQQQKHMYLY